MKMGPRLVGLSLQENMENRWYEEKQMTARSLTLTGASSASKLTWHANNWLHISKEVQRLQMRIAKAVREKRYGKVKALQWLLTHSLSAKLLAVKRVVSNPGAKTPGVDGVLWRTPKQKMHAVTLLQRRGYQPQPLRRIYIPKDKGRRPLSIPSMIDRSMQALHLLALEPVVETKADKNAYGFRPKRSTADAIEQCFNTLARESSAPWILEGDIRACFDNLSAIWLENNILVDKILLSKWLTAGYIKEKTFYPTFNGVPQGGIISPALLVLALSGLEEALKKATSGKDKVNGIFYADDFIITGASKEVLEHKVMPLVVSFLKERGLELSSEKTLITHVDKGFDFLGFHVRKYKGKFLSKPSKKNVKAFLKDIRILIKSQPTAKTEDLIRQLNSKIRGWAKYFQHAAAKKTFSYVDHYIFKAIMQWVKRRHPEKSAEWKYKKYFRSQGLRRWIFSVAVKDKKGQHSFLDLFTASQTPIRRHVKIKAEANPYDPQFKEYFLKRNCFKRKVCNKDQKESSLNLNVPRSINRITGSSNGL
ncbi:MAG: group II intron reverse transcriptase/maturase [Alphaproteobacteria bacterium]|nr:group II intron reverse transcriptase/maturase [Alphaproteobacteria bacterium]